MKVRKVRCPSCGAPKVTPNTSSYVYCDYCGQYMDWDVSVAKAANAGPVYRDIAQRMAPEVAAAIAAGDRARLGVAYRAMFDAYMQDCADTYSPRIKDPVYREAILARTVYGAVAADLDPATVAAAAAMTDAVRALEYDTSGEYKYDESYNVIAEPKVCVKPAAFWRMMDAFAAKTKALTIAMEADPTAPPDPDDTPPAVGARVSNSLMVQGWIKMLDPKTADELLDRTGLRDEYQDVPDPTFHDAACTGCHAAIHAPEGSYRVLCAKCGIYTSLGRKLFCGYCGAPMTFGLGAKTSVCGACKAETKLMDA